MDLSLALATFLEESRELLAQMEDILLRADRGEAEGEDMNALFRCAHTIKGSAGLFGWMRWCTSPMAWRTCSIACATAIWRSPVSW